MVVSTQVLNEFAFVMHRKRKVSYDVIAVAIDELMGVFELVFVDLATIQLALKLAGKYRYSYFDSLMIASALEVECDTLYTEDLHHSQVIEQRLR